MSEDLKLITHQYWRQELSKEEFVAQIQGIVGCQVDEIKRFFGQIIEGQNADDLEYGLSILYAVDSDNRLVDIVHQLLVAPWHRAQEELIHDLQHRKLPESIPFIKEAMQKRYDYLESYGTGTRQFINQCGHALWSIGTQEAIDVIREFSQSGDLILKDEMQYRLSRIEGRHDYQRTNFD